MPTATQAGDRTRRVRELASALCRSFEEHIRQVVSPFDLTPTQAATLRELDTELTQREVATRLRCEPSNVTFVIDKLEERGLLSRRSHPTDRRAKLLVLTGQGQQVRSELLAAFAANEPLAHLSPEELGKLESALEAALPRR